MPHRLVSQTGGDFTGIVNKHIYLSEGELIFRRVFGGGEVGIYGFHAYLVMDSEEVHQSRNLRCHEAQAVHPGVELDMNRKIFYTPGLQRVAKRFKREQIRYTRLKTVFYDLRKKVRPGGEHKYGQRYAVGPQLHTLHRESHSQIVRTLRLKHGGELHRPVSVSIGLDEHEQPC